METMGQTKKRDKKSDGINPTKKKKEKVQVLLLEQEMALRREELEIRKQE